MERTPRYPESLGGKRDFAYITPIGRRLSEYEAVTCYTQPQSHGGGLQTAGDYLLLPDGRPIFKADSTRLQCADWFAYRDPNQMWQRPYYVAQSQAEKSIELATQVALSTGLIRTVHPGWIDAGLVRAVLPFAHYEYALFRALNNAARESLSDTINNILLFNAADKLRHAQALAILSVDLEAALEGFDGKEGKASWLQGDTWQPVRRLVEQAMATIDWCEAVVAVDLVIEPLIGQPFRDAVLTSAAAAHRDVVTPAIGLTATADWHRNARAVSQFVKFLVECPGGEDNRDVVACWVGVWKERVQPVAEQLFCALEESLGEPGLTRRAQAAGAEEFRRVGADKFDPVPVGASPIG